MRLMVYERKRKGWPLMISNNLLKGVAVVGISSQVNISFLPPSTSRGLKRRTLGQTKKEQRFHEEWRSGLWFILNLVITLRRDVWQVDASLVPPGLPAATRSFSSQGSSLFSSWVLMPIILLCFFWASRFSWIKSECRAVGSPGINNMSRPDFSLLWRRDKVVDGEPVVARLFSSLSFRATTHGLTSSSWIIWKYIDSVFALLFLWDAVNPQIIMMDSLKRRGWRYPRFEIAEVVQHSYDDHHRLLSPQMVNMSAVRL